MRITVSLIFTLALLAGVILLQIYLSKRESKWPGLVLPIIAFLFGLLYPLNMAALSERIIPDFVVQIIVVWLLGNIPAFVFLAIYFSCQENKRRNQPL